METSQADEIIDVGALFRQKDRLEAVLAFSQVPIDERSSTLATARYLLYKINKIIDNVGTC